MRHMQHVLRYLALPRTPELYAAQHEAAHIVVGVSLGLHLGKASAREWQDEGLTCGGYCWFAVPPGRCAWAEAVMVAAGVVWERATHPRTADATGLARYDWADLLSHVPSRHDAETCVRAAGALLAGLGVVHARVTRALLERDLTGADMARLARGERLTVDE
jgi:hypothetical protein